MRPSLAVVLAIVGCAARDPTYALRKELAGRLVEARAFEQAEPVLKRLYLEDPDDVEVLTWRGTLLREQGLLAEAELDLRRALAIDDDLAQAHAALAIVLDLAQRGADAEAYHRRAAALAPHRLDYLNNLGVSLFTRGLVHEAIEALLLAARIDPRDSTVCNNLGFAWAAAGDLRQAALQFARAGTPAQAANNLGIAYERGGNLAQARAYYARALALDPALAAAQANLARFAAPAPAPAAAPGAKPIEELTP